MKPYCKNSCIPVAVMLILLFCMPLVGQGPADLSTASPAASSTAAADPIPNPTPQMGGPAATSDSWHGAISIYGWFPGIHGTVGVLNHDASIHAPFSDVFHFLKGVIPVAVELDKGRFVAPIDFFWVKLGDDRAIPLTDFGQTSVNLHITESIFTPKLGYRIVDGEHLKVDALAGIRYWYGSQDLRLVPSGIGFSRSANWVDGLGGARFILPIGPKAAITVAGDAGGGGANLDYQVVGLFTYDFTRKLGTRARLALPGCGLSSGQPSVRLRRCPEWRTGGYVLQLWRKAAGSPDRKLLGFPDRRLPW